MNRDTIQREVDENYKFFLENKDGIDEENADKFVLIRHKEFLGFYDTKNDAITAGRSQFADGVFSVQEVSDTMVDLGSIGYALL